MFFSTSNAGGKAPAMARNTQLKDANDIAELQVRHHHHRQGGDYTKEVFPSCAAGWNGHWIDAASPCAWRATPSSCSTR